MGVPFLENDTMIGMIGVANRPDGYEPEIIEWMNPLTTVCTTMIKFFNQQNELKRSKEKLEETVRERTEELQDTILLMKLNSERQLRYFATMSHEIRTPMHGVISCISLLKLQELDNESLDLIKTLEASGDLLLGVVDNILDYSKIESRVTATQEKWFTVQELIDEVVAFVQHRLEEKNIKLLFVFKIRDEEPRIVPSRLYSDPSKIVQVLTNLINNAIRYSESRSKIELIFEVISDKKYTVEVVDYGKGMDEETVKRAFEPFYQEGLGRTRKHGGIGLGLSICEELMQVLKGSISAKSELGKGSIFICTFPMKYHSDEDFFNDLPENNYMFLGLEERFKKCISTFAKIKTDVGVSRILIFGENTEDSEYLVFAKERPRIRFVQLVESRINHARPNVTTILNCNYLHPVTFFERLFSNQKKLNSSQEIMETVDGNLRVLIAEDNIISKTILRKCLTKLCVQNYRIASDGIEVVDMYRENIADVVVLDLHMPKKDGFEALGEIKNIAKDKYKNVFPRFVMCTADTSQSVIDQCEENNIEVVHKPYGIQALAKTLKKQ